MFDRSASDIGVSFQDKRILARSLHGAIDGSAFPDSPFYFPARARKPPEWAKNFPSITPLPAKPSKRRTKPSDTREHAMLRGAGQKLRLTEITQPAILTVSVAATRVLAEAGSRLALWPGTRWANIPPTWRRQHQFCDAVRTVRNRGKYMQEAVPVGVGAMAAILALGSTRFAPPVARPVALFAGQVCEAANINSHGQVVISGSKAAVEHAAELCKHRGAKRAVMLPVSAPFHCALMQPAQDRLAADLAS